MVTAAVDGWGAVVKAYADICVDVVASIIEGGVFVALTGSD